MCRLSDELATEQVFDILRQLRDIGCFYLGFSGGEIFLRSDIMEIIHYAYNMGFNIILLTNASLIDTVIADKLKNIRINKIDITVHSMDKGIFDRITGVRGSAKKVFKAIQLLKERDIPIALKSSGMTLNKKEIPKISAFARQMGVFYRFDSELVPCFDHSYKQLQYILPPETSYELSKACYPEMFAGYDLKKRRRSVRNVKRNRKKVFNCGVGYTDLTINPFGELKLCIEIDYPKYNILEGSLKDGWEKIKDFVDKLSPPIDWECRDCNLADYCRVCPGRFFLTSGKFFGCDDYTKKQAEFNKSVVLLDRR